MNPDFAVAFENKIVNCSEVRESWGMLKPVIGGGQVASKKEAYLTFSRVLKISNGLGQDDEVKKIWKMLLKQGCFSIQGTERHYDFKTVLSLFKEGKKEFDITWIQFNYENDNLETIGEGINAIALDSIGSCPGDAIKRILRSPLTFGMVAQCSGTPIACVYGTFVESLQLFHFNFLGRKINYPGVHIIEQLQSQIGPLLERFPKLSCITLCVQEANAHAQPIYQSLGFKQLDYVEVGFGGDPMYFYGRKLDDEAVLPRYEIFKQAYDDTRQSHLTS